MEAVDMRNELTNTAPEDGMPQPRRELLERCFDVGLALKRAQHELRLAINVELAAVGTTISQLNILRELAEHPGISSAQLARLAFLTPQTLGQQVIQMEERGLVERRRSSGRRIQLFLTPAGRELLEKGLQRTREVDAKVLGEFDDDELAHLLEAFQTIEHRSAEARLRARRFAPVVVEP
jgi:DNA-binding MarR family transcriptional regulator